MAEMELGRRRISGRAEAKVALGGLAKVSATGHKPKARSRWASPST